MDRMKIRESSTSTDVNQKLREVVVQMFEVMHMDHGKKFIDLWISVDPSTLVDHWCNELKGFTPREIKRGLELQKALDWPPTTSEFKKLCRPSIDAEIAFREALKQGTARECGNPNEWSSPAIFWAWREVGAKAFREQHYSSLKKVWEKALADQFEKGVWDAIPPMVLKLEAEMRSTQVCERGRAKIQESLKGIIKKESSEIDHRLWARRTIERFNKGDKNIPMITLKNAREVLRVA